MRPFFEFRSFCICTGLNVEVDRILEIACIITDGNLTKTLEVYSLFFFWPTVYSLFDDTWCGYIGFFKFKLCHGIVKENFLAYSSGFCSLMHTLSLICFNKIL